MKKLLLGLVISLITIATIAQSTIPLGNSRYISRFVGIKFQLQYLKNGVALGKILSTDASGNIVLIDAPDDGSGGSYTLPIASTIILGGIKVDGTTVFINSSTGVISVAPAVGGEPVITAGSPNQFWAWDKTFKTINTSQVSENVGFKYYTDARVLSYGNTVFAALSHNHTFDGLSNVNVSGKAVGDIPYWNGTAWTKLTPPWLTNNQTITLSGDVTGTGNISIVVTIPSGSITNAKLATVANNTFKGRASVSTGVVEDLTPIQVKNILGINLVDNTADADKIISTPVANALSLKANTTSPNLLGLPTAPTASAGSNSTQIANTAFVHAEIASATSSGGYVLPIASSSVLGGIKIGTGLNIAIDGTVSTVAGGTNVTSYNSRTGAVTPQTGDYSFSMIGSKPTTINGYGITDAFTQTLADSRFSLLNHTHAFSSITATPNDLAGYGILNAYTKAQIDAGFKPINYTPAWGSITGTLSAQSDLNTILNNKAALSHTHLASDITGGILSTNRLGTGATGSGTKILYDDNTFKDISALGVTTNAELLTDIQSLMTFGAGSGNSGDNVLFNTSAIYGSILNSGVYSYVITAINIVLQGTSPSITVDVRYGTTLNSGGTSLLSGGTVVTNTTTGATTSMTVTIPPGNFIWCKTPTVPSGTTPTYMQVTVIGRKIRN